MWSAIEWRLKRALYNHQCKAILATPPIRARQDGVVIFSMIGTQVLIPYLVAAKSLDHHLGRGRFVIMDDGTLTDSDKAVLREHLGDPRIIPLSSADVGPCPTGGTWERLLTLLDMAGEDYVIQLDSDTVITGPIPEVVQAVADNASFTLLGAETPVEEITDVADFTRRSFPGGAPSEECYTGHIQGATEAILTDLSLPGWPQLRYVRGCSGFTGFARGQNRQLATAFSQAVSAILGPKRWSEWGTEQVTSSFVIANDLSGRVLPSARYINYWGETLPPAPAFLHFIGTYRWHRFEYLRWSMQAIRELGRR